MKKPLLVTLILLFPIILSAQIEFPGNPWSRQFKLKSEPESVVFPGITVAAAQAYLSTFPRELKSMVFAFPFDTLLTAEHNGTWETLNNGSRIWRLSLYSHGALSLNLIFKRFVLPAGASVYIYSPDYQTIHGAFTNKNQTPSGVLATAPIPGDNLVVEINLPANPEFMPVLEISKVSHDFKGFYGSGDCNVDINCPAGASWQKEKRAVVKFIRGGVWLCSGALINNTRNDGRPLLLTANHTIGTEAHAEQTVFFFKYERPTCGSGSGTYQTLSGSKLLATTAKVDFSLVELTTTPPRNYEPYYAGWDRKIYPYLDTVTCIHHPNGDVKKISKSYHKVFVGSFGGGYDDASHWNISDWDLGTTEPGSSGSPLFNIDHRIVGDLTGGDASCSYNKNDFFQMFSVSWDKYPDSTSQLKHWLDPNETGAFVVNGFDPYAGGNPVANYTIRPDQIQVGRKVYFNDLSTGLPKSWRWTFENGNPSVSNLQVPLPVKFSLPGTYHVTLTVSNDLGSDSLRQTITVADYPNYSLSESRIIPGRHISLTDQSTGAPLARSWSISGASPPVNSGGNYELSFLNQGEYSVNEIVEYPGFSDTLIHYNQIKVIPDVIAFRSFSFNNVAADEHTGYTKMGQLGYLPGSNNQGVTAYAEAFRNTSDTAYIIHGISLPITARSNWSRNYYLPVVVWNANRQVIVRDSLLINNFLKNSRFTKWLKNPVSFDTLVYVGFEVRPWSEGTFVSKMAIDRGSPGPSTAFAVSGTQWQSFNDYAGIHTSLDLSIETSVLMNSYKEEIKILPNYNDGKFSLDLGNLVFSSVDVSIFNIKGQQVVADVTKNENQISFRIVPPVAGVYIVRLMIDKYEFATKLLILK